MRNYFPKRPSGASLHTFVKIIWCSLWFCNPPPYFEAVHCFICGRRMEVVARYRMICLVLSYQPRTFWCVCFLITFLCPRMEWYRGHIVFVMSVLLFAYLDVVNFNIRYNFRTVRDIIFCWQSQLMIPFQMTPRSMIWWSCFWLLC